MSEYGMVVGLSLNSATQMSSKKPNLITTIGLYSGGILLVIFAVLLLLQATGIVPGVSKTVYIALVLLAVGCGLLYGIGNRA